MKVIDRIFLAVGCIALVIISWVIVLNTKSSTEKQAELISQATGYIDDKIYIYGVPLLEEAANYNTEQTFEVEAKLKEIYLQTIEKSEYRNKYVSLLEKQMRRKDASPEIFIEAANFYLQSSEYKKALTVLKDGISKTEDDKLVALYEANRYRYKISNRDFEDVTDIHESTIGVRRNGLWGIATSDGSLFISCEYEKVSTFSADRAIVHKDDETYAVDSANNRIALLKEDVADFGNYANGLLAISTVEGWKRTNGEFAIENVTYEQIGTYYNGYAAAKQNGKWGVIDVSGVWHFPAEHDEILMDELGRSFAQGTIFVKKGGSVYLFNGALSSETFDDARPFNEAGYAAVKKNEKWGFINTSGEVVINYQFEDALSFRQDLAAVKQGELWGYINLSGKIAIDTIFKQAKSFANGNAPVLTESGWQFITLIES